MLKGERAFFKGRKRTGTEFWYPRIKIGMYTREKMQATCMCRHHVPAMTTHMHSTDTLTQGAHMPVLRF